MQHVAPAEWKPHFGPLSKRNGCLLAVLPIISVEDKLMIKATEIRGCIDDHLFCRDFAWLCGLQQHCCGWLYRGARPLIPKSITLVAATQAGWTMIVNETSLNPHWTQYVTDADSALQLRARVSHAPTSMLVKLLSKICAICCLKRQIVYAAMFTCWHKYKYYNFFSTHHRNQYTMSPKSQPLAVW